MWRWNDKLRPIQLSEIEKQAHKMIAAFCLAQENSRRMSDAQKAEFYWKIIAGGLADYFYRLVITDIKPPVFYKIRQNREHYKKLTDFVIGRLRPTLSSMTGFWQFAQDWHYNLSDSPERDILSAAHLYASGWEFNLIRPYNSFDEEIDAIAESFTAGLAKYSHLNGLADLIDKKSPLGRFASLCGQLRFQIRWTQVQRIPATTVLGHMFIVAAMAFLYSQELGFGRERSGNNFFTGLFHDFPEVLTRDIITPVKSSFADMGQLIRCYEKEELERRVLLPLRNGGKRKLTERLEWFLGLGMENEFMQCCREGNKILAFPAIADLNSFDKPGSDARDGELIKICDLLAAFLEAHTSLRNGASAMELVEGRTRIMRSLEEKAPPELEIRALLADFNS